VRWPFTEYGDVVRVVDIPGVSLELCGGTHVSATGHIALFRFTHQTGAAAGVRRIEAVTGPVAYELVRKLGGQLDEAAGALKTQPEHLVRRIEQLLEENKKLEKRVEELLKTGGGTGEAGSVEKIGDIDLHVVDSDLEDRNQVGLVMDAFRANTKTAIMVVFTSGERPGIHVAVTDDPLRRDPGRRNRQGIRGPDRRQGRWRPHFASAGVGDATLLANARAQASNIVKGVVKV
jgi:alanyl-tRNA synthetase